MNFGRLADAVKSAAPLLSGALGLAGPAGAVAGRLVAAALGTPEGDEDAALAAVAANPEAVLALKRLEADHTVELEKLAIEAARVEVEDRQGARAREQAVVAATGRPDYHLIGLAWTMVGGFLALTALLTVWPPKPDASGVVYMLYGSLATAFGGVVQYYFGSSAGSKKKTEMLGNGRG